MSNIVKLVFQAFGQGSGLSEAINRCWKNDGNYSAKAARNRAFGEYCRARDEIRKRSMEAKRPKEDERVDD